MTIIKSAYLTIPVSNLQSSANWYGEHFGFKIVTEDSIFLELMTESGVRILFQHNDHNINSHMTYSGGTLQSAYGFIVSDAELLYKEFIDKGINVGELFDYQGKSFSFYDPDGNYIEVWSLPEKTN
ncbi:VOC family protein [Paenibacillus eucommiae]|uniref:Catechol 2,3-dioxygenase-like lactoylglutathione lyase family enzyme n=1 Tax=Paenibacillus eucommiae TaxID=1355755 RepID=A0ABS4J8S8_9BACL|nr:VOC family protein [Paenibacillus eucommiae]MBP1996244.1 catechol 2,3-dioxygenase-like lactoylglutathione lyase family enzyme [Paenibacillus eucommiae]